MTIVISVEEQLGKAEALQLADLPGDEMHAPHAAEVVEELFEVRLGFLVRDVPDVPADLSLCERS